MKRTSSFTDKSVENYSNFRSHAYFNAIRWIGYKSMMVLMVILAFASSRIAMLNLLSYEFAAIVALFLCHFTAILIIREFDSQRKHLAERSPFSQGPHSRLVVWGIFHGVLLAVGWLLFLPFVLIILLGLVFSVKNCNFLTGLGFYFTIPLVSVFFSAGLGSMCATATSSRPKAYLLYWFIVLVFFARVLIRLAAGHTIGMNDPFVGSIDLPLYEQEANLDPGFLYSRVLTLLAGFIAMISAIVMADTRFQKYGIKNIPSNLINPDKFLPEIQAFSLTAVLIIAGLYFQGPLGIEITRNYLEHKLDGKVQTEHYIIRYPKQSEIEKDIERIAELHEYYYWSIVNELETAPSRILRAYVYPDRKTKSFLTGVGPGVYAKPWTGEIHVEYSKSQIRSLKHELVHVISASMGIAFFGSSMLGSYGEGIAEGIEWNTGNDLTHHQWAAALREAIDPLTGKPFFPRETAPENLLNRNFREGGFYVGRIGMNYYLAASHTRWFLDTFGIDAYKAAYIRNDTLSATGLSKTEEARKWMEYLDHVSLTENDIAFAEMAFAPPKFTLIVCAHEVAKHERLAGFYSSELRWMDAYREYSILHSFAPNNIRYVYYQAMMLYNNEDYDSAFELVSGLLEWQNIDTGWTAYIALLQGDILARSGQVSEAREKYNELLRIAINDSLKRTGTLRLKILESDAREEFYSAMKNPKEARWRYERAREMDETWLSDFMLGLDLLNAREYELAEEYFLNALRLDPEYRFIRREGLYYLGVCSYYQHEYSLAKENFREAYAMSEELFIESHPAYDSVIPLRRLDSWSSLCHEWLDRIEWRINWQGIGD
ncbi:MAG TPA: hypothetical protein ENN67_05140 [Firmicutes bacterium]|nr:hypothetical protein [Bacillota bacterium]